MRKLTCVKCPWCEQLIVGDWKENGSFFKARKHSKPTKPGFRYTMYRMQCPGTHKLYPSNHENLVAPG